MKLLDNTKFEAVNADLSIELGDCRIEGRIESYSCKMAGTDKKLFKQINNAESGSKANDLLALSPPQSSLSLSPSRYYGRSVSDSEEPPLCDTISRKLHFYLIGTLNASFQPDYDFSHTKSEEFSKEPSLNHVMNEVDNNCFKPVMFGAYNKLQTQLWHTLDEEIALGDCELYSYKPDPSNDPYGEEGCLWSFNYFFYNKKMKRIVFFTCRCSRYLYC